jgi:hypothetical protein
MTRGFKSLTTKALVAVVLASAICPAFAQTYSYKKPATTTTKAAPTYNYKTYSTPTQNYSLPPLQGRVVTVPQGAVISGAAPTNTISTQYVTAGDTVSFVLNSPYYYNGTAVLPAGTTIVGNAVIAQSAGFTGKYGKLKVVFNTATLPTGQRVPISGKIATEDGTGILTAGTGVTRATSVAKNTAVGAGAGALTGLIGSAISGGDKSKGTAIMTGIGGGLGLGKSLINKGNDVVLQAGQPLDIQLDQPLTVSGGSTSYDNYNY